MTSRPRARAGADAAQTGGGRRRSPQRGGAVRECPRSRMAGRDSGPRSTQNSRPAGGSARSSSQGLRWVLAQRSMPTSRRLSPLPWRINREPRLGSRSVSLSASASLIRSPARQSTTMRSGDVASQRVRDPSGSDLAIECRSGQRVSPRSHRVRPLAGRARGRRPRSQPVDGRPPWPGTAGVLR